MNNLLDCPWIQEDDWEDPSIYATECGKTFLITEGTPDNNDMKYCCYCGKKLIQILFKSEDETD